MADEHQLKLIREGVKGWNKWRKENPSISVDLSGADLIEADLFRANLQQANLREANLSGANLRKTKLIGADLREADLRETRLQKANLQEATLKEVNLSGANLRQASLNGANLRNAIIREANLSGADLSGADLIEADFFRANLRKANLKNADLSGADLREANCYKTNLSYANLSGTGLQNASLVETKLEQAILTKCKIYGISAWALEGTPANQSSLVITPFGEAEITVDDLQVAQFVYLLLNNKNVRNVIDTITSKAVLILGRFTDERKVILEALQSELRQRKYLPILFDFTGPQNRDITETVSTLAHMAKFVIADITDAKSIPQELQVIVPNLPSVPVQPMLLASQQEYGMFEHYKRYPWVLPTYYYQDVNEAVASLSATLLPQLEDKVIELRRP